MRFCLCIGTYGNGTHLKSSDECTPCPPGKYCSGRANNIWDGNCEAGYWCIRGASQKAPIDGETGQKCSPGYVVICRNMINNSWIVPLRAIGADRCL